MKYWPSACGSRLTYSRRSSDLPDEIRRRARREWLEWILHARSDDPLVLAKQDDLNAVGGAPFVVDPFLDLARGTSREAARQLLGAHRILAHAQIQRSPDSTSASLNPCFTST